MLIRVVVFPLQFFHQHRICPVEFCLLRGLPLPPPHIPLCISVVYLEFRPWFFHIRALILLLPILRQYYRLIDSSAYLCNYSPVIYWTLHVQSELLDPDGAFHKVRKWGAGAPCLLDPHLVFWDHKWVDQELRNNMRQEIPRPRVLKTAMEVPHLGDVFGGGVPPASDSWQLNQCWYNPSFIGGIWCAPKPNYSNALLSTWLQWPAAGRACVTAALLHEYARKDFLEFLPRLDLPIVVSFWHLM